MNSPLVFGLVTTFSLAAGACAVDTEEDALPTFVKQADGRLALVVEHPPAELSATETQLEPLALASATQPWEPGSGFYEYDENDPESREYYSNCESPGGNLPFDYVIQVVSDASTGTRDSFLVATSLPPAPFLHDVDGEEFYVGKRLFSGVEEKFAFESSYVDCSWPEPNVLDLRPWGIDAVVEQNAECHEYWDYGQDRYRELYHRTNSCEGADCGSDFITTQIGSLPCAEGGMGAFKRIPSPF